ncbi:hypothetical protein CCP2SC5_880015 [Azospirillaceae bacterium]
MNRWSAVISRVDNGYEVREYTGDEKSELVCEDSAGDELISFESVLWEMLDFFSMGGSRYDKERLVVSRQPGDKYGDTYPTTEKCHEEDDKNG